jgi:2-polyprenyl-3-methyl-5-hydroxy-6-metoxy-1,4-benzoquinol methylase
MQTLSNDQIINALYASILGREPDVAGFENYTSQLRAGATLQDLITELVGSEEFKKKYLSSHRVDDTPVNYLAVGLRDSNRDGWYSEASSELCPGFAITSGDTVADVGCGDGGNIIFCARYAFKVIAVDVDSERLSNTERSLRKEAKAEYAVHLSDGNPLPIDTETVDKIICMEVLEHVDDPGQFIDELVRIGKPGALYLLTVPDALSEAVLKQVAHPSAYQKPNHIRVFSREEFESLVLTAGLQILEHRYRGFYWAVWHALAWRCGFDVKGRHPILDHWAKTWMGLIELPQGDDCIRALDRAMPKSQMILARKGR